ncbi:hypothetical protein C789_3610 [Microcystis aeruginosa FACHB-905 = DIANCHI905]|nr:hypothetical protein C789_3610 [Microcystis aeruginosa FACHB-905 = DIANCHI905]
MIDQSLCPLCLCGSFHSLARRNVSCQYILPSKPKRSEQLTKS